MQSAVVLLSGGLDSTVLLHYVARELRCSTIYGLSFQYGQKHDKELQMAAWQAERVPQVKEHAVLALTMFRELVGDSTALVQGGPEVPSLDDLTQAQRCQPPTYVPNRNLILLATAAAFAEARGCPVVFYGAQMHDQYGYWDCTPEFVQRLNAVLALNRGDAVRVEAPFAGKRKSEEIRIGMDLGVDFRHTWSCYRGGPKPCLTCPTCVERRQAFAEAGMGDPLEEE